MSRDKASLLLKLFGLALAVIGALAGLTVAAFAAGARGAAAVCGRGSKAVVMAAFWHHLPEPAGNRAAPGSRQL